MGIPLLSDEKVGPNGTASTLIQMGIPLLSDEKVGPNGTASTLIQMGIPLLSDEKVMMKYINSDGHSFGMRR